MGWSPRLPAHCSNIASGCIAAPWICLSAKLAGGRLMSKTPGGWNWSDRISGGHRDRCRHQNYPIQVCSPVCYSPDAGDQFARRPAPRNA